jgi:O-antigen/teichoic acid export membrane protein
MGDEPNNSLIDGRNDIMEENSDPNSDITQSYSKNFMQIYFWQILSIMSTFLSLFIVLPRLTDNLPIYGVYAICISFNSFFSYADLGFISTGFKYASEAFAKKNKEEEVKITGYVIFVYYCILTVLTIIILILSINPPLFIKNLSDENSQIASNLLIILGVSSFLNGSQKFVYITLGIRLETYKFDRIRILFNIFSILSVLYFFKDGKYDIVGYFFFFQVMQFLPIFFSILILKYQIKYDFKMFFANLKFSKEIFEKTKHMIMNTIYLTIIWILYFEIDLIIIGKIMGSEASSIYAIALTMLSFIRPLFGMLYTPFVPRYNHFIALKKFDDLRVYFLKTIYLFMPIILLPSLSLIVMSRSFILSWVGPNYEESIILAQLLLILYSTSFIDRPASILMVGQEKFKLMALLSTILIVVFWTGVISTFSYIGILAFALFKLIGHLISFGINFNYSLRFLKMKLTKFTKQIFFPIIPSIIFIFLASYYLQPLLHVEKDPINLLIVLIFTGILAGISIGIYYIFSKNFRKSAKEILIDIFGKTKLRKLIDLMPFV